MTCSFASPAPLPYFADDIRRFDVWADGYQLLNQSYDGFRNKVEIQPLVRAPGTICALIPVGQSYTIGVAHLQRLILRQ